MYVVRHGGCDYLFVYTYVLLLSRAWDHVGFQDRTRKRAEGLKLKSKSYFIWARIPQRHASNLRNSRVSTRSYRILISEIARTRRR